MESDDVVYKLVGSVLIRSDISEAKMNVDSRLDLINKQMYVENILKSGKRSDAKPYKRNPDLLPVPHAVRSVKLATLFIDLTEDEEWAILCHDGLYDFMKYDMQGHETQLSMIIHWADMWASKVLEGGKEEGEE